MADNIGGLVIYDLLASGSLKANKVFVIGCPLGLVLHVRRTIGGCGYRKVFH